jgi:putative ABC transport system substrate-binding protein
MQGLRELGWVEGKSFVIESRYADGHAERLADLAADLVRLKVDLIFAGTSATAAAAKAATSSLPIVTATGADAVELGLVESLARPGGNVTGMAWDVSLHRPSSVPAKPLPTENRIRQRSDQEQ